MLEEKISDASRQSRQKALMAIGACSSVLLIGVLIALGTQIISALTPDRIASSEQGSVPVSDDLSAELASGTSTDHAIQQIRDDFKSLINQFQSDIEPQISSDGFEAFNAASKRTLIDAAPKAVSQFMAGDYQTGIKTIEAAIKNGEIEIGRWQAAIEQEFELAQNAYAADQYRHAKLHIDKVLRLAPDHEDIKRLAGEIALLPDFLKAIAAANVAQAEGNLDKEYEALAKAKELAPGRVDVSERLLSVSAERDERDFTRGIQQGLDAVARSDLKSAKKGLSVAEKLGPERQETALLKSKIKQLSIQLRVESLKSSAQKAIERDDWEVARSHFKEALALRPSEQGLVTGYALSKEILGSQQSLGSFINRPNRLSASNVRAEAALQVDRARSLGSHSKTLRGRSDELDELIEVYSTTRSVTVVSDELTRIRVLGVGVVGSVNQKVIQLSPGTYKFEGVREGFRAKIIPVTIRPGDKNIVVEVICDEPI